LPSPIGHSLIGLIVFSRFKNKSLKWNVYLIFLVIFVSNLPDLDFLPGIVLGEPNRYHHGITHSFGFVVILSIFLYFLLKGKRYTKTNVVTIWFFSLSSLHVFLDFFAKDTTVPYGEPLFWPIWRSYSYFPYSIFLDIRRANDSFQFFPSLFSYHNFQAILIEILFAIILWLLIKGLYTWYFMMFKRKV
jgi:inner membrane protein